MENLGEKGKKVSKVVADKEYDLRDLYDYTKEKGVIARIMPKKSEKKAKFARYSD